MVVSAGAIETARLLLVSDVGTAHGQVGRYLQGHAYAGAVGVFDEVVQDCVGPGPSVATTDLTNAFTDAACRCRFGALDCTGGWKRPKSGSSPPFELKWFAIANRRWPR